MTDSTPSVGSGHLQFPVHEEPRVWLISSGDSSLGISLTRQALAHGDFVVAGVTLPNSEREDPRSTDFGFFLEEVLNGAEPGWADRLQPVSLDVRMMSQCQAAIASAINKFGRVDILLCCTSQAIIGSVEELAASQRSSMLVKDQFETNYFGPVNLIKALLPHMRTQGGGHIMVQAGITGHIGTPGLGVYCASGWALEGFCDSLTYEVAPFNIRVTILQSNVEIGVLANLITSVPPMPSAYSPETNHAPLFRGIMNNILSQLPAVRGPERSLPASSVSYGSELSANSINEELDDDGMETGLPLSSSNIISLYPPLGPEHLEILLAETVYAITAIGGHDNPPARHIVGAEAIASVKEKLKTVSEELEEFIESSCAVDIGNDEGVITRVGEDAAV